jgi:hypothetical protein
MAGFMTRLETKGPCACSCHAVHETNVIWYSCECDIEKMPTKPNTINLSDRD